MLLWKQTRTFRAARNWWLDKSRPSTLLFVCLCCCPGVGQQPDPSQFEDCLCLDFVMIQLHSVTDCRRDTVRSVVAVKLREVLGLNPTRVNVFSLWPCPWVWVMRHVCYDYLSRLTVILACMAFSGSVLCKYSSTSRCCRNARAASYEVISDVVVRGPILISLIWAAGSNSPDQQNPLVRERRHDHGALPDLCQPVISELWADGYQLVCFTVLDAKSEPKRE